MLGLTKTSCKLKWNEFINLIDPEKRLALETQLIQLEDVEHPAIVHTFLDDTQIKRHFKHFSHTFTNSIGQPLRTVGLIQDITEEFNQAKELERQAITDELTKLYNRRKINASLRELINDTANTGLPFSIMLFDLDHFKRVNDAFGHNYGDEILMATADAMRKFLPNYAQYGRWGGEEFLIVVNNVSLTDACNIAQHIKNALNTIIFPNKRSLSASFGVTQFKKDDTFTTLLTRVDQLMYEAKQSGRNLVVCG
jgi:diguanylate cyclase (GGDEF)-like protein